MAMTNCRECGKPISSKANICPHCGAKPPYRPGLAFVLISGLLVVFGIRTSMQDNEPVAAKSATELAAEEAENMRSQLALGFLHRLKKNLRDPDSLDVISVRVSEHADLVCAEYRARNGFGGFSVERYVMGNFGAGQDAETWNANCTGTMFDYTYVKNLL